MFLLELHLLPRNRFFVEKFFEIGFGHEDPRFGYTPEQLAMIVSTGEGKCLLVNDCR